LFADGSIQENDYVAKWFNYARKIADISYRASELCAGYDAPHTSAFLSANWAAHSAVVYPEERDNQSCLLTLHIGGIVSSTWSDESIAVASWHDDWRTEATANLAEHIAEGNLGLAGVLADELQDAGCDNEVWLRILRECPEIIRPGMWFWDRLRGIQEPAQEVSSPSVRVATSEGIVVRPGRLITGTV
jgi:hypothetical protein